MEPWKWRFGRWCSFISVWFSGSRLLVERGVSPQNLLFGYETTNHCITKSFHTFNQCTYWCCRNLVMTVINKLQNSWKSWKIPLKLVCFANLQVLNWFFYSHRNLGKTSKFHLVVVAPEECRMSPKESNLPCEEYWNSLVWCLCTTFMTATNRFGEDSKGKWVLGWFLGYSTQGHETFLYPRILMRHHV